MPSNYPIGFDNLQNPTPTTRQDALSHADLHADTNDAIEAIEAAIGLSSDTAAQPTIYGRIKNLESGAIEIDIEGVNGLQAALDEKADVVHTHPISDVAGLQTTITNLEDADVVMSDRIDTLELTKAGVVHTHSAAEITSGTIDPARIPEAINTNARLAVRTDGTLIGTRRGLNLIAGSGVTISGVDNNGSESVDVTIESISPETSTLSLNGQTGTTQTFANDTNVTINSSSNVHTLGWSGQLAVSRGGTGLSGFSQNGVLRSNGSGTGIVTSDAFTFDGQTLSAPIFRSQNGGFKTGDNAGAWFATNRCAYVFRTQSTGGEAGTDTGGYTDITTSANAGLFQPFGTGAADERTYFGFIGGLPHNFVFSSNNGGTTGTVGAATWAYWDGSVWQTSGITTGANADLRNAVCDVNLPTLSSGPPTTTINGVTAVWIRVTVTSSYTVAPNVRMWPIGVRNHSQPWENSNLWIGARNLAPALYSTVVGNIGRPAAINIITPPGNSSQNILQCLAADNGVSLYTLGATGEQNAPLADNTFRALTLNGGDSSAAAIAVIGTSGNARSMASWLTDGALLRVSAATRTNNSTPASGTAATAVFNSFAQPTLAATNANVTTTNAATVYIANAPAAGTNMTLGNSYALWVDDGRARFDGQLFLTTAGSSAGIIVGGDVQLYRSAANILGIPDIVEIRSGNGLRFNNSADTKFTSFAPGSQTVTINYTLPVNAPALNDVLKATSVSGTDPVTVTLGWASDVGQRISSGVVVLTDGANISLDASLGNHFRVTLGGNRTLNAPTNAVDGQRITIEVIQDGTGSRTLTLTTGSSGAFIFGTDITGITLTTTANKRDLIGCVYSSSLARWMVVSVVKGF